MDLNLLTALDALLETGSVTAAAQRLHRSTPAMSHTLARVREMVGDPILVRAGRKLVPTPRALELREPVGRLLAQANALFARKDMRSLADVQRTFVVRAPDGIPVVFGASLALALQQVMPLARLQFLPEGHSDISALREGRIDLDLGSIRGRHPEIEVDLISTQTLVGAVVAGHPFTHTRPTAKRYAAERHVVVTARLGEVSLVDAALESLALARFVVLQVPSAYAALVVAARSHLIATVPGRTARAMQAALGLDVFELPFEVPADPVVMAWHPRHGADAAHAWLRACFKRVLGDPHRMAPPLDRLNARVRRKPTTKQRAKRR